MKSKISVIVFILMEIILGVYLVMLFITPVMKPRLDFSRLYDTASKNVVDNIIQSIKDHNVKGLTDDIESGVENIEYGLTQLDEYFTQNNLLNEQLVDCSFQTIKTLIGDGSSTKITTFKYAVTLEKGYGVITIELAESDNIIKIRALKLDQLDKPPEEYHTFYGQPINTTRIVLFLIMIGLILFVMYTEYDYYKTASKHKIWLQILLPISAIAFSINWNSLMLSVSILTVNITPVSIFSPGIMGEWKISFYLPIMTMLYWIIFRKKERIKENVNSENN
jgi:hypothetical protein